MKALTLTLTALIFIGTADFAAARPPNFHQEVNSDQSVTTTVGDTVIHDSTREGGKQTKEDLERQGLSQLKSFRLRLPVDEPQRPDQEIAPKTNFRCQSQRICDEPRGKICVEDFVCRQVILE